VVLPLANAALVIVGLVIFSQSDAIEALAGLRVSWSYFTTALAAFLTFLAFRWEGYRFAYGSNFHSQD
jgi:hypothetical protein